MSINMIVVLYAVRIGFFSVIKENFATINARNF